MAPRLRPCQKVIPFWNLSEIFISHTHSLLEESHTCSCSLTLGSAVFCCCAMTCKVKENKQPEWLQWNCATLPPNFYTWGMQDMTLSWLGWKSHYQPANNAQQPPTTFSHLSGATSIKKNRPFSPSVPWTTWWSSYSCCKRYWQYKDLYICCELADATEAETETRSHLIIWLLALLKMFLNLKLAWSHLVTWLLTLLKMYLSRSLLHLDMTGKNGGSQKSNRA